MVKLISWTIEFRTAFCYNFLEPSKHLECIEWVYLVLSTRIHVMAFYTVMRKIFAESPKPSLRRCQNSEFEYIQFLHSRLFLVETRINLESNVFLWQLLTCLELYFIYTASLRVGADRHYWRKKARVYTIRFESVWSLLDVQQADSVSRRRRTPESFKWNLAKFSTAKNLEITIKRTGIRLYILRLGIKPQGNSW